MSLILMFTLSIGSCDNRVTLQELIKQYNLTDKQLNSKIDYSDTPKLALYFDNVELYSSAMRLPPAEQADVNMLYHREGTQTAMMKCLKIWKQHNPYQATYRALLNIVLEVGKGDTADKICQQLTQRKYYTCHVTISRPPPLSLLLSTAILNLTDYAHKYIYRLKSTP